MSDKALLSGIFFPNVIAKTMPRSVKGKADSTRIATMFVYCRMLSGGRISLTALDKYMIRPAMSTVIIAFSPHVNEIHGTAKLTDCLVKMLDRGNALSTTVNIAITKSFQSWCSFINEAENLPEAPRYTRQGRAIIVHRLFQII